MLDSEHSQARGGERKPFRKIAELLARYFSVETGEQAAFVEFARAGWTEDDAPMLTEAGSKAPWRTLYTLRTLEHLQRRPNNLPACLDQRLPPLRRAASPCTP